MDWDVFLIIAVIFLVLTANVLAVVLRNPPEKNVAQWARSENLQILSLEVTERRNTTFSWLGTNFSYMFYRVRVKNADGTEKNGYLCVAGQLSPLFAAKVRARWDAG